LIPKTPDAVRWRHRVGLPAAQLGVAELLLIALVYGVGVFIIWRLYTVIDTSAWYTVPAVTARSSRSPNVVRIREPAPLPVLMVRWFFRLSIWTRFLWQVSRINLSLVPTHPDRVGGLGFLAGTANAFIPLAVALGAALSGMIANRIFHLGPHSLSSRSRSPS